MERTTAGGVVVEPCTGTGAVTCALAAEVPGATVAASDICPAAVAQARADAERLGLDVRVFQGDLLDGIPAALRGHVDVLVCNPPYLAAGELVGLEPEVVDYDPRDALVAGPTGHEVVDRLIAAAQAWLAPGGWLLLEVDPSRAAATIRRMAVAGLAGVEVAADLTGADRFAVGRRRG